MNAIFDERFKVCTWDVDRADRLTLAAAFNYFQDAAGHHASDLGVGTEYMREHGQVWILSRMSARIDYRPGWGARLRARTWPRGTDRLFAVRDYELWDEAGERIGVGRSAWLIVDAATFRPRRPEELASGLPSNDGLEALPGGGQAIRQADGLSPVARRSVAYSDLDYNGHMNNARYVQWIQDALDPDELAAAPSLRLDINYLSEMLPGEAGDIYAKDLGPSDGWAKAYSVEGRPADGSPSGGPGEAKASFRAELFIGA